VGPSIKVVALVAVALVASGVGLVATGWPFNPTPLLPASVAACLCLSSAIATLLLIEVVQRVSPGLVLVAIMLGTILRLGVAIVGVVLLGEVVARFGVQRESFALWVVYLYIVTLIAECGLLVRGMRGRSGPGAI
jgi:hypothetical protein